MFNLFRICRKDEISFDIVAEIGNIFAETATVLKQHSTFSKESFDL